ncbi:MAG: acetyl-CoA carboxylase biotin carboxylase subunit [Thermoplasmatota archaeon]
MFRRILVANRGEIAVRIVRAAHDLGAAAVAVYSEADRDAPHVRMADEAVAIGPAPPAGSYLDGARIVEAALRTGAQAVHPGYGFLSERPSFARQVQGAGLAWIGPSPEAMEAMGNKVQAREEARKAGVPLAEGSPTLRDALHAKREAERLGFPLMMKAAAGGGGLGMRVVRAREEVEGHFRSATQEAQAAFGDGALFFERYLDRPRHIEVQVLGDHAGHLVHLGERECSIQRRHQKLIEEAPSPALNDAQRVALGRQAVALAARVGYTNAGTMEFLYQDGRFHFNEMNTRLQVEHPVTEMVTGIDIVGWQIRIAAGERLTLRQEDIASRGHAFEARINAEDPENGFLPSPGRVEAMHLPGGPGVRVDSGLAVGWSVPTAYDSMVLKLVVHGVDRAAACQRMRRALGELSIEGFPTNLAFHQELFSEPDFQGGKLSTRYLEEHDIAALLKARAATRREALREEVAAIAVALEGAPGGLASRWARESAPRMLHPARESA